jgi:ATP-dependent RNA helicase DeaD
MPPNIQKLAQQFLRDPGHISVVPKQVSAPSVHQFYYEVQERMKFEALCRLLDMEPPELAIVFGRTKRRVAELTEALIKRGYAADGLHGDLSQNQRDTVMRKFREGSIDVLVATDVAARGLDISGVTHVINFDLPQDPESYVHRIGRTGRAGKEGTSWTFVTPREMDHLRFIEKVTRHRIARKPLPTLAEAMEGKQRVLAERLLETLRAEEDVSPYKWVAVQLLEQHDSVQLLAAALKLLAGDKSDVPIELTPEDPIRTKKRKSDNRGNGARRNGQGGRYGAGYAGRSGGQNRGGYRNGSAASGRDAHGGRARRNDRWLGSEREDGRYEDGWPGASRGLRDGRKPESKYQASEDYVNI